MSARRDPRSPLVPLSLLSIFACLALPASAGTGTIPFVRGDANSDGVVNIADAIYGLGFLFSGGPAPHCFDAADANDDGSVDIGDSISILAHLFSGAGPLPPPFPAPGSDPTPADPYVCGDPCQPAEFCNGIDDDCDGAVDEEPVNGLPYYIDSDDDGFGDGSQPAVIACTAPPGRVADRNDCDDADDTIFPGATEFCDGEDDDCDGDVDDDAIDAIAWYEDDDDDGFGDGSQAAVIACTAPPGRVADSTDCDDADDTVFPGATELCDGEDQDCDGFADEVPLDDVLEAMRPPVAMAGDACTIPCQDGFHGTRTDLAVRTDCNADAMCEWDTAIAGQLARVYGATVQLHAQQCSSGDARLVTGGYGRNTGTTDDEWRLETAAAAQVHGKWKTFRGGGLVLHETAGRSEVVVSAIDVVLPGIGTDFVFAREYRNRRVSTGGPMGHQWVHSYEIRAHLEPDGLHIVPGAHREEVLELQPDGVSYARVGVPFVVDATGPDLTVHHGNGGIWKLSPRGGGGGGGGWRLSEIRDALGNSLHFAYDASDRLASVLDTVGQTITLGYDTSGRITTLSDGAGRVWSYAYYAPGETGGSPGDLKSVTTPAIVGTPNGNDFPLGRTTLHTYTSGHADDTLNHNLLTVTDPRGNQRVAFEYDLDPSSATPDALVASSRGGSKWKTFRVCADPLTDHGAVLRLIESDDRGAVTERFYDPLHRCVMTREFTGFAPDPLAVTTATDNRPGPPLRPSDPTYFETRFEWNDDHRITRIVHPDGNETQFVHEVDLNPMAPHLARTNLRQVIRTPGSHPGGGAQPSLVDLFEVQPGFGGFHGHHFRTSHTNPRGTVVVVARDAFGNAISATTPIDGAQEDYEYDPQGRLTAVVHASSTAPGTPPQRRRVSYSWVSGLPSSGLVQAVTDDALGTPATTSFTYDLHRNLAQVVHPNGGDEVFVHNALGELVLHQSPAFDSALHRYETRCWYDANGNRVRVDLENRDADGVLVMTNPHLTTITEYDAFDFVSRMMEEEGIYFAAAGQVDGTGLPASEFVDTRFLHDAAGRLLRLETGVATDGTQPDAVVVHEYDERDLPHRSTRAPGTTHASTGQWSYTKNGLPNVFDRFGFATGPRQSTSLHDGYDRVIAFTDAMGNVRSVEHDANGNVTRTLLHGELDDVPGSAANVRLEEEEFTYDALDRLVSSSSHRFDPVTQSAIGTRNENWIFSGGGHLLLHTDDSGDATTVEYDSAERLHRVIDAMGNEVQVSYDLHSNPIAVAQLDRSTVNPAMTTLRQWAYAYDALDRRVLAAGPSGEVRTWAHAWHGVARAVDERGNVSRVLTDALGRVTRTESDLTATGSGGSPVTGTVVEQYAYDDNGRRTHHIDANGHTTEYFHDPLDRLVQVLQPDGLYLFASFDAHGDRVSEQDANGTVLSHEYDALSRRISTSVLPGIGVDPGASFAAWSRDGAGRVRSASNDDATVTRVYDSLGHRLAETIAGLTTSALCDDEGHPVSVTLPSGRTLAYAYDPLGRVAQVTEGGALHASFSYLGPSLLERRVTADGVTVDRAHDLSGRLLSAVGTNSAGTTVLQHGYTWDPTGNLASRLEVAGGAVSTRFYAYDSLDRLTSSSSTTTPDFATYELDAAGNRLFVGGLSFAGPYSLDPTLPVPADAQMHQYTTTPLDARTYSSGGELSTVTPLSPAEPPTSYQYDGFGRLVRREQPGALPIEYAYDPFGRNIAVTAGAATYRLCYSTDPGVTWTQQAVHDVAGSEIESSVLAPGVGDAARVSIRRLGLSGAVEDHFLHADSAGSTVALTSSLGDVIERYEYADFGQVTVRDAFGNAIPSSLVGNEHLFHGQRLDPSGRIYIYGGYEPVESSTGRLVRGRHSRTYSNSGARSVPSDPFGGNPTSGRSLAIGDLDRDGRPDLARRGAIGAYEPRSSTGPSGMCRSGEIPNYLDPDDDNDGVSELAARGEVPRSGTLAVSISGVAQAGLRVTGGGGGGGGCGGTTRDGGGWTMLSVQIDRDLYPDAWSHSPTPDAGRAGPVHGAIEISDSSTGSDRFHTTTPGHKSIDTITLRGAARSGKNIRKSISVIAHRSASSAGKRYNLHECFPMRWDSGDYSASSTPVVHWTLEVRVDRIEMK